MRISNVDATADENLISLDLNVERDANEAPIFAPSRHASLHL